MEIRIAVIVTLGLAGVATAVIAVGLARAAARSLAGYLDSIERFAAAAGGCPPVVATWHRPARSRPGVRIRSPRAGSKPSPPSLAAN